MREYVFVAQYGDLELCVSPDGVMEYTGSGRITPAAQLELTTDLARHYAALHTARAQLKQQLVATQALLAYVDHANWCELNHTGDCTCGLEDAYRNYRHAFEH